MLAFWLPFLAAALGLGLLFGAWKGRQIRKSVVAILLCLPLAWYSIWAVISALQGVEVWRVYWGYILWGLEMVLYANLLWVLALLAGLWLGTRASRH